MKEHETMYLCMPHGPVNATEMGPKCAFCDTLFPDQAHINSHNAISCAGKPRRYTRKVNLARHLETHGVLNGSALAEDWRVTPKKRFFSCGFCLSLFYTISDQLNHIDNHFRHSEDITNWNFNKVVRGLLLQPGVDASWRTLSAEYVSSGFSWDSSLHKDLQMRLELSEESAEALAVAAFNESVYDDSHGLDDDPGLTMRPAEQLMDVNSEPATDKSVNLAQDHPQIRGSCANAPLQDRRDSLVGNDWRFPESGTSYVQSGALQSYPKDSTIPASLGYQTEGLNSCPSFSQPRQPDLFLLQNSFDMQEMRSKVIFGARGDHQIH